MTSAFFLNCSHATPMISSWQNVKNFVTNQNNNNIKLTFSLVGKSRKESYKLQKTKLHRFVLFRKEDLNFERI